MVTPLISPDDLAGAMAAASTPALLDVRWSLAAGALVDEYRRGHIPGARFVDLDRELAGPPGPGRHPLPAADAFGAAMRAHGVSAGRSVVVYDARTGAAAARLWWLLRFFGHADVRQLDGGLARWVAEGRPVSTDDPPREQGDFRPDPGHMPLVDAAGAARLAAAGVLLDARAAERFRGEVEPVDPVAGHIPGARSAPTEENLEPDGRFRDPVRLRERFASLGAAEANVGVYCGSGVTAAHEVLALAVAGLPVPALYAGSWSDWITHPGRRVARGPR
jgi:thiosulfate/3-mercaptopyruvate sulfurtransferase